MFHKFDLGGVAHELWLAPTANEYYLRIADGWSGPVAFAEEGSGRGSLTVAGTSEAVAFAVDGDVIYVHMRSLRYVDPLRALASVDGDDGHNVARAPMPGTVVALKVAPGDAVTTGTVLIVIESMKLETQIRASQDGIVERLHETMRCISSVSLRKRDQDRVPIKAVAIPDVDRHPSAGISNQRCS